MRSLSIRRTLATGRALRMVYDRWRLRRAVRELQAMEDWRLRDIGISRAEIDDAVRFGRRPDGIQAEALHAGYTAAGN